MIGRLLCRIGLHKLRWESVPYDWKPYCERPGCDK